MERNNASILHMLICKSHHASAIETLDDEDYEGCLWYLEEQIAECWDKRDHQKWLGIEEKMRELANLKDEELHQMLQKITKVIGEIYNLWFGRPELRGVVTTIITKALSARTPLPSPPGGSTGT